MSSHALIFGANSAIARAMTPLLRQHYRVTGVVRSETSTEDTGCDRHWQCDYSEGELTGLSERLAQGGETVDLLLCCLGALHWPGGAPEKKLADLNRDQLHRYFEINSVLPALLLKHFTPLMPRRELSRAVFLSAKIGGISANTLGGWYGYRASKAALNMLLKTAAIELRRRHKGLCLIALHPGTTDTPLSQPFGARLPADKLFSPELTAERLCRVIRELTPEDSGRFVHWDGTDLPW